MSRFDLSTRNQSLNQFENEVFDLVIVGGGINGAGAAREACLRGMKVALIEAHDFASGTSSRSSKLIHGGIRYLENLEFHLVFEALNERTKLFRMAPHLVHPLRFMIPLYEGGRVGMFKMGLGMWLYDALSLFEAPELHERLNPIESEHRQPSLKTDRLLGSYIYSDAYMDDDRLVFETLRSAQATGNLSCASYLEATGAEFDAHGKLHAIRAKDQHTKKSFLIRGRHFLSTVGAWTDDLGQKLLPHWKKVLRPTKGVHLTFDKKRFPLESAVVMAAEQRIVFAIPRHEMVIVGTTDTDEPGDPSKIVASPEDVRYLLGVVREYFPKAQLGVEDILATYAGVRPLVKDEAQSEGKTSREHSIWTHDCGLTFVGGGKYTTYRLIAEQAIHECLRWFPIGDRVQFRTHNSAAPLNPLVTLESFQNRKSVAEVFKAQTTLTEQEIQWLVDRHGDEALELKSRYGNDCSYWEYEAQHAIDQTMCFNLVDFYARRVPLILAFSDHGLSLQKKIVAIFQERLQWSYDEAQHQEKALHLHLQSELDWKARMKS